MKIIFLRGYIILFSVGWSVNYLFYEGMCYLNICYLFKLYGFNGGENVNNLFYEGICYIFQLDVFNGEGVQIIYFTSIHLL